MTSFFRQFKWMFLYTACFALFYIIWFFLDCYPAIMRNPTIGGAYGDIGVLIFLLILINIFINPPIVIPLSYKAHKKEQVPIINTLIMTLVIFMIIAGAIWILHKACIPNHEFWLSNLCFHLLCFSLATPGLFCITGIITSVVKKRNEIKQKENL